MALSRDLALNWLKSYHAGSASLDADRWFEEFHAEDVAIQYANNPIISGADARQLFKTVFAKLDLMTHQIVEFEVFGSKIYQAATIRYVIKGDDPERDAIEIPGFAVFHLQLREGERPMISRADIYVDPSPVFNRIAEKDL